MDEELNAMSREANRLAPSPILQARSSRSTFYLFRTYPAEAIFLAFLVLSPFLFGAVHTQSLLLVTAGVCFSACAITAPPLPRHLIAAISCLSAWLLFGILNGWLNLAWCESDVLGTAVMTLAAASVLCFTQCVPYDRLNYYLWIRLLCGVTVAVCGLAHWFHDNGKLFGVFAPSSVFSSPRARWPFVNPNHFAIFLIVPLCLATHRLARAFESGAGRTKRIPLLERVSRRIQRVCQSAGVLAIIGLAIAASASKNGCIMGFGAVLCSGLIAARRDPRVKTARLAVALAIIACGSVVLVFAAGRGGDVVGERLVRTGQAGLSDIRWTLISDSLPMFHEAPLLGTGWGSWNHRYEQFRSVATADIVAEFLHCDPLQFVLENGIAGSFIAGSALFFLFRRRVSVVSSSEAHSSLTPWLVCGASGVFAASFFDFPFRIPALLLWWMFDLGVLARVWSGDLIADPKVRQIRTGIYPR